MLTNHARGEAAMASEAALNSAQINLPGNRVATGVAVLRLRASAKTTESYGRNCG